MTEITALILNKEPDALVILVECGDRQVEILRWVGFNQENVTGIWTNWEHVKKKVAGAMRIPESHFTEQCPTCLNTFLPDKK